MAADPSMIAPEMREPFLSEFKRLIREGAASQDVHDGQTSGGFASTSGKADERFVTREVERVQMHLRSLAPLLERGVGRVSRVLDFGCGTGGTTLALALCRIGADEVVGVDANASALRAAEVRAAAFGIGAPRVRFQHVPAGAPLPDGEFDLVVTVSVLEFITDAATRYRVVAALRDKVRPGGYLFIATPKVGVREYHTRRLFGDFLRRPGLPWSSSPFERAAWTAGWPRISVQRPLGRLEQRLPKVQTPILTDAVQRAVPLVSRWHKLLLKKPL